MTTKELKTLKELMLVLGEHICSLEDGDGLNDPNTGKRCHIISRLIKSYKKTHKLLQSKTVEEIK